MDRLTRAFYERMPPPPEEAPLGEEAPVLPMGVVDGRAAAGLEAEATTSAEPGVGSISGAALLRVATFGLFAAIACAAGRWDVIFALFAFTRLAAMVRWRPPAARMALRFVEATGFALLAVAMWRSQHGLASAPWVAAGTVTVLASWVLLFATIARPMETR
jgi:hypothetical protein